MAADIASFSVTVLPERIVTVKRGIEFPVFWPVGGGLFVGGVDGHRRRGGCGRRCRRRAEQGEDKQGGYASTGPGTWFRPRSASGRQTSQTASTAKQMFIELRHPCCS